MLVINEKYMKENIYIEDVINSIEQALLIQESGNFYQPDRIHLGEKENPFLLMPCFKEDYFSTKLITVYPKNNEVGEAVTQGVTLLNDIKTGKPLALLNGTYLTALRTGCVGGISSKYLAKKDASSLAIIGAGVQSLFQVLATCAVRPIRDVYVYSRTESRVNSFIKELQLQLPHINFHKCNSSKVAVEKSEIVICATTSANPVIPDDINLYKGKHIIGIGSYQPHTRELPNSVIQTADYIYTDTLFAIKECGDLGIPIKNNLIKKENIQTLGKIIHSTKLDDSRLNSTTVFKSVGIGLFDLCAAEAIYKHALKNGKSINIDL
ncbi:ornithine cyclodeaminase family protein [Terrisporobacter sp.]